MDKKRSLKNIFVSIFFKILLLISSIIVRKILIQTIGNEVNGLNSLYISIIGVVSIAELGVGTSIVFCMYRPIVEGDNDKVKGLYCLYKRLYYIIAIIITVLGLCVLPFLPILAKDYQSMNVNLYFTFILVLISVIITYLFSSKTSLINAYKNNYVTTTINSIGLIVEYILQIIILLTTKSFVLFLLCKILASIIQWGLTEIYVRNHYYNIITGKGIIDDDTQLEVKRKVLAMFSHKLGGVLVNTADSIIISSFLGVIILGKYSNYTLIMTSMTGVLGLFFSPLTSVIGHLCVNENKIEIKKYFNFFYTFNFILGCVFFYGYFAVIDETIKICFGDDLNLSRSISFVITINYFIQFMRNAVLLFRDATGTFYNDRFKPIFEGTINIVLSIIFVLVFPEDYKVVGVIVATIFTNVFICHLIEPYVLFKYGLETKVNKYYLKNYFNIIIFILGLLLLYFVKFDITSTIKSFFINGFFAVAVAMFPCGIAIILDKDFRKIILNNIRKLTKKIK